MLRTLLFTALIGIVLFTANFFSVGYYIHPQKWEILAFFATLSLVQHRLMEQGWRNNREKFVQFYLTTVVIKLLLSLIFVGIFLYLKVPDPNSFVLTFFVFYLFYTIFEIYGMVRNLRRDLKK
ncbi:MAG: hypothetical protein ACK4GN_00235 [Runella sp.]